MQVMLVLLVLFLSRGANVAGIKLAQRGRVSTLPESVVFVTIYSALQALLMLLIPPYQLIVTEPRFYIFPFFYALFYFAGNVLLVKSLQLGSASIANTIGSFNSLVVIAFGMCFWQEKLGLYEIIGLILFVVGLALYNGSSFSINGERQKISAKFLLCALASMLMNGTAVIFTKLGMQAFPECGKHYLFYYSLFAALIGAAVSGIGAPRTLVRYCKDWRMLLFTALAALCVDVSNTLFVSYINAFPSAIFLPSFSVVGMLGILIASRVILKERISKSALISSMICIVAVLLLNIS